MSDRIPEHDPSPLGDLLESLPEETPPEGLLSRCQTAVRGAQAPSRGRAWTPALSALASAAACLLLVVSLASIYTLVAPAKRATMPRPAGTASYKAAPRSPLPAGPGMMGGGPTGAAPEVADATAARKDRAEAPAMEAAPTAGTRLSARPAAGPAAMAGYGDEAEAGGAARATDSSKPWRDLSGDPRRLTSSELELEARDVPATYDRACTVITKAGGTLSIQEIYMDRPGREAAHISARVPQDRLDGVVAQLRQLGKVVRYRGESEDRTREYQTRGADIRNYGQEEMDLVARYQAERNRARKAELYRRIQALRATNRAQKSVLGDLAYRTQMAELEVTIQRQSGPGAFLAAVAANAGTAIAWVGATAIIWVPLLVLLWIAIRRRRA